MTRKRAKVLVSVQMITYNHDRFIEQAILSVLNQKTTFEYELIVADDHSPDNTEAIVKSIIDSHPKAYRLNYHRHKRNIGMIANGRYALEKCCSKYVAICEGDDYWTDPLKLEKQVDFLETNNEFYGVAHQTTILSNNQEAGNFKDNVPDIIEISDLLEGRLIHTNSILFRQSIVEFFLRVPDFFSGDRLLFLSIAISGKFGFLNKNMAIYRKHEGGMSSNFKIQEISKDLLTVPYLSEASENFPRYRYLSYIYASMGLSNDGGHLSRIYYLFVSFAYSFSYFPKNLSKILRFLIK